MNLIIENFNDPRLKCELCTSPLNMKSEGITRCCGRIYLAKERHGKFSVRSYTKEQYARMENVEAQVEDEDMQVDTLDDESANLIAELESTIEDEEETEFHIPDATHSPSDDVIVQ